MVCYIMYSTPLGFLYMFYFYIYGIFTILWKITNQFVLLSALYSLYDFLIPLNGGQMGLFYVFSSFPPQYS